MRSNQQAGCQFTLDGTTSACLNYAGQHDGGMPKLRWSRETVEPFIRTFLLETTELSTPAWDRFAAETGAPSSDTVVRHLQSSSFPAVIAARARLLGFDRTYRWSVCPDGVVHGEERLVATPAVFAGTVCSICEQERQWRRSIEQNTATFAERCPEWVHLLVDPADAGDTGWCFELLCPSCEEATVTLELHPACALRVCRRCYVTGGGEIGTLVERRGGGDRVRFDTQLANALADLLAEHALTVQTDCGVVVPAGSYHTNVIKPDLIIPELRIAVEQDRNDTRDDKHSTSAGETDDITRDKILAETGWRVLRVRRPGQPVRDEWPWRVETTSMSARIVAVAVRDALVVAGHLR